MRFYVWRDFRVRLIDIAVGGEGYSGYLLVYSIHVDVGQLRKDDDQELNFNFRSQGTRYTVATGRRYFNF